MATKCIDPPKVLRGKAHIIPFFVYNISYPNIIFGTNLMILISCSLQKSLSDPSITPESLPSFEGMVPALPGLVARVLKNYIHVPYPIRSRPNALNEDDADELVEHIDKIVQTFTDISVRSGLLDGRDSDDQIPYVHVKLQAVT